MFAFHRSLLFNEYFNIPVKKGTEKMDAELEFLLLLQRQTTFMTLSATLDIVFVLNFEAYFKRKEFSKFFPLKVDSFFLLRVCPVG